MNKSTFIVADMDCLSEEQLIRLKLDAYPSIQSLQFDLPNRLLDIHHTGDITDIATALDSLALGASLQSTTGDSAPVQAAQSSLEKRILITVLLINFGFFALEITAGVIAQSMGLIGDSLDMLADAFVYGLSLLAVGKIYAYKQQVARLSGWLQLFLALIGFVEVIRRFIGLSHMPVFELMIIISTLALIGNAISLILINKARSTDAHMQSSAIFTSNDIFVNLGVIAAGVLVLQTASPYPDLLIGAAIFTIVTRGAFRILKLAG